jgi:hypothetical protein
MVYLYVMVDAVNNCYLHSPGAEFTLLPFLLRFEPGLKAAPAYTRKLYILPRFPVLRYCTN